MKYGRAVLAIITAILILLLSVTVPVSFAQGGGRGSMGGAQATLTFMAKVGITTFTTTIFSSALAYAPLSRPGGGTTLTTIGVHPPTLLTTAIRIPTTMATPTIGRIHASRQIRPMRHTVHRRRGVPLKEATAFRL